MGRKIKGFSFDPETDKEVIRHIEQQQNGSKYIWGLVRKDIEAGDITERLVKEYVEKFIKKWPPSNS